MQGDFAKQRPLGLDTYITWVCTGYHGRLLKSLETVFLGAANDIFNFNNEVPMPTIYYFLWF